MKLLEKKSEVANKNMSISLGYPYQKNDLSVFCVQQRIDYIQYKIIHMQLSIAEIRYLRDSLTEWLRKVDSQ